MDPPRIFPLSHFVYYGDFKHYYAFGNTPAEDFLQSIPKGTGESSTPAILSLGCGDMRSCMYTLWKNFGLEGENRKRFDGVNFVLNDCSAPVLARNILFLYLCLHIPDEKAELSRREWIASVWGIWYNHELQPKHNRLLSNALDVLLKWSDSLDKWSKCQIGKIVGFTSATTFERIKKIWCNWHSQSMKRESVGAMKSARCAFQDHHFRGIGEKTSRHDYIKAVSQNDVDLLMIQSYRFIHSPDRVQNMKKEYEHYLMEGTVAAEYVLDLSPSTSQTVVNPTLYEREDGKYTLQYALTPYIAFPQRFQYTHAEVCRTMGSEISLLPVADCHFLQAPLLANSVQQFGMWLIATSRVLQRLSGCQISFVFDLDDALNLCYGLLHHPNKFSTLSIGLMKFDAIYTSNLLDHISPPVLVLSALPLLKSAGTLFTTTFRYLEIASTGSQYLEKMFGICPELFPIVLGVRCLGHDGNFCSSISSEPSPNYLFKHRKTLIWRNVKSQSLIVETLEESSDILESLLNICTISCLSSLASLYQSIETFVMVLHRFLGQLHSVSSHSHKFLEPLSQAIRAKINLKPHLLQLQTQSLLHGLHMHITVTESECPVCTNNPLDTYIQQFTTYFDTNKFKRNDFETPTFTVLLNSGSGDYALITSMVGRTSGSTLALDFFLPKQCLCQYRGFTVFSNQRNFQEAKYVEVESMDKLQITTNNYLFLKGLVQHYTSQALSCPFGDIVKHIGNACSVTTLISVNEILVNGLKCSSLKANIIESNQLQLTCGTLRMIIVYPYTIDESKVNIKVSKKSKLITVNATRAISECYDERPVFYVDPSNKLTLPRFRCSDQVIEDYCNMQIVPLSPPDHPLFNAKRTFIELFKYAQSGEKYFTLSFPSKRIPGGPDVYALVYVHDIRFNITYSAPVLDVSYCFLDTKPKSLTWEFGSMHNELGGSRNIMVDDAEYNLLKRIFHYFTACTYYTLAAEKHTVTLPPEKNRLWEHFSHAIFFPLYPNPEHPTYLMLKQKSSIPIFPSSTEGHFNTGHTPSNSLSIEKQVQPSLEKHEQMHLL